MTFKACQESLLKVWKLIWKCLLSQVSLANWFSTIFCIFICEFPDIHLFFISCNLIYFFYRFFYWFVNSFYPSTNNSQPLIFNTPFPYNTTNKSQGYYRTFEASKIYQSTQLESKFPLQGLLNDRTEMDYISVLQKKYLVNNNSRLKRYSGNIYVYYCTTV